MSTTREHHPCACAGLPTGTTPPPHGKSLNASMVAPAKRQLPFCVSKSVGDPNGGAVALRDLSAIDAPNQLAQDHARSEIRSQPSYSDAGSSVSPVSSIARSAASSSLGKRRRAVAPSAIPASPPPAEKRCSFTPADDQSLRDLVGKHGAGGDWGQIARSLREGKWSSKQCRERYPRPPAPGLLRPSPSTAPPRSTVGVPCPPTAATSAGVCSQVEQPPRPGPR